MKNTLTFLSILFLFFFVNIHGTATAQTKSKGYQKYAKIKMSEAISIAQTRSTGRLIESSLLENENSVLFYDVTFSEIDKSTLEIKIDASTGIVLSTEKKNIIN